MNLNFKDVEVRVGANSQLLFKIHALSIPHGSRLLISGPSGKGKTTFLHLIAGLLKPVSGSVTVGEQDVAQLSDAASANFRRQQVALLFQNLNLLGHLTALENVRLEKSATVKSALQALEKVGLASRAAESASALSLGEQQRIAVARVLVSEAKLVLADEPTSSLDDDNARLTMKLLVAASEGKTLIVVSHDHRIESFFTDIRNFEELMQ